MSDYLSKGTIVGAGGVCESSRSRVSFNAQPQAPATSDRRRLVVGACGWALNKHHRRSGIGMRGGQPYAVPNRLSRLPQAAVSRHSEACFPHSEFHSSACGRVAVSAAERATALVHRRLFPVANLLRLRESSRALCGSPCIVDRQMTSCRSLPAAETATLPEAGCSQTCRDHMPQCRWPRLKSSTTQSRRGSMNAPRWPSEADTFPP